MPIGTAANRLRKMILFSFVQKLGKDSCFQCGKLIESSSELSIEHKQPWLNEDPSLFWDLTNIAFSHLRCNVGASSSKKTVEGDRGTFRCCICREYLPADCFGVHKVRWNSLRLDCKNCRKAKGWDHKPTIN